jgi:hypothetical protein
MKFPMLLLAGLLAATAVHAEPELEGREGLIVRCEQNPGNTASFCACLAERAVAELPSATRQILWIEWSHPSIFNFKAEMTPHDLPEAYEKMWGGWQRKTVPACNAKR